MQCCCSALHVYNDETLLLVAQSSEHADVVVAHACRQIVQVDAMQHSSSFCQFEPDALVNAIRHIVESHLAAQDSTSAQSDGTALDSKLGIDVREAPPVGFHDL